MNKKFLFFVLLLFGPLFTNAQNGRIISRQPFELSKYDTLMQRITEPKGGQWVYKKEYDYLNAVTMEGIFYESDGLKVKAYLVTPKESVEGGNPAIIYNRGGNREFGSLNEYKMAFILARVASWGYNVVGSQYRGNDGGEGLEEFGGVDVNDVLNLIPLVEKLPNANPKKIGMYGWSRGGMMTYLTLMKTNKIKAAVVGGALSDLKSMYESRDDGMEEVFIELIPNYDKDKENQLRVRSAVFNADKLCKTTPILLLHGTADWRVVPEESLNMALAMQKAKVPYSLIMFEGGDHGLNEFDGEVDAQTKAWFKKYLDNNSPLPDLDPHGR